MIYGPTLIPDAGGRLTADAIEELRLLHRQYALRLGFIHADAAVDLDGAPDALVTELLRLADLGAAAELLARGAGGDVRVGHLVAQRSADWDRKIRP